MINEYCIGNLIHLDSLNYIKSMKKLFLILFIVLLSCDSSFKNYFNEKKKLFFFPSIKVAVINIDDLYGKKGERLCLHAAELSFIHPFKKSLISFKSKTPF